jgi:hypothetical protein
MGARYQPDQRLALIAAGVASAGEEWRGGDGVAVLTGTIPSGGITLQYSPDNGDNWGTVHVYGTNVHAEWTTEGHSLNFKMPACRLRASATGAGVNLLVVSV